MRRPDCATRAWHNDRHQPIRGSVIQQIFRIVNENHCPPARKNKEWQEKLPVVVLKAEEILYSKANSEAEYSNLGTLWDRVSDAINTIIRRDESSDSGELLPRVEAALNLGCFPVRASRSEQHGNPNRSPRSYRNLRVHEPVSPPPEICSKVLLRSVNPFNFERATSAQNVTCPVLEYDNYHSNFVACHGYPCLYKNMPPCCNELMMTESGKRVNLGSVYALYYGSRCSIEDSQLVTGAQVNTNLNTIFVGKPIRASLVEPLKKGVMQNFFPRFTSGIGHKRLRREEGNVDNVPIETQCDLSLRLGLSSGSCTSTRRGYAHEDDLHLQLIHSRGKSSDCPQENNEEVRYVVGESTNNHGESNSSKWSFDVQDSNSGVTIQKRKELLLAV